MIQDRVFAWDIRNYTGSAGNISWYHGYEQRNSGTVRYPIIVNWSNGNRDDTHNWLFCIQPYKDFANGNYSDYTETGSNLNNPGNWNAVKWVLNDWDGMHNNGNRTVGGDNRRAYWIYQLVIHALAAGGTYYGDIFNNNGMEGGVKRDAQTLYNNALAHAEDHGEREISSWNEDGNGGISLESGNWDVSSRSGLTTRNGEKYYTKSFNVNRWGNADNPSVELKGAPSGTKIEGSTILIPVSAGGNARSYQFQIVAHSRRQNYRHRVVKQAWVWTYKFNEIYQRLADVNSYSEQQYTDIGSTTDLVDAKTVTVYPAQNQVVPTKSVMDDLGRNVDVGQKANDKLGVNIGHRLTYKLSTKVLPVPYEAQFNHGFTITDNVPAEVTLNSNIKLFHLYQDGREVNKDDYGTLTITGNTVKFDFKNSILNDNNFYGHTYALDFEVMLDKLYDLKSSGIFQINNSYITDVSGLTRISNVTKVNVTSMQKRLFTTQVKSVDYDRVKNQKITSTGSISHNAVVEPWRHNVYEGSWSTDDFGGNPTYDSVGRGDLVGALQFTTGYGENRLGVHFQIPIGYYVLDYGFLDTKSLSVPFDNDLAQGNATGLYVPQKKLKKQTDDGLVISTNTSTDFGGLSQSYNNFGMGTFFSVNDPDFSKVHSSKKYTVVFILRAIPNEILYSSDSVDYLYKMKNKDIRKLYSLSDWTMYSAWNMYFDWHIRGLEMSNHNLPNMDVGYTNYVTGDETGKSEDDFHFSLPPLVKVSPVSVITMPKLTNGLWHRNAGVARVRVIYKLRILYHDSTYHGKLDPKLLSQISNLYVTLNGGTKQKVDLSSLANVSVDVRDLYFSNDYDMTMKSSPVWSLKLFNSDYDVRNEQFDSNGKYLSKAYDFGIGMSDVPYYGSSNNAVHSVKPLVLSGGSNEEAYRSNLEIPTEYKMFSSTYNPKTNSDPYFNKTNNGLSNKTVKYVVNNYSLNSGDSIQTEGMTSKGSSFTNADKADYVNGNVKYYQAYPNTTKTYYNESTVTGSNDISQKAGYFIKTPSIAAKLSEWRPTTSDANALVGKYKSDISSMNLKVTDSSTIFSAGSYDRVNNKETKDISLVPTLQSSSVTGGTVDSRGIIKATELTALANTLKAGQASQLTYNTDVKNAKIAELQKVISGPLSSDDQKKYYSDNSKVSYVNPAAVQTSVSYAWPNVYISESNNNTGGIVSRSNSTGAIEQRDRAFLRNDLLTNHAYHLIYSSSGLGIDKVGSGSITKNVNITGYRFLTGDANKQNKESNSDLAVQGYKGGQRLKGFSSSENDWLNR